MEGLLVYGNIGFHELQFIGFADRVINEDSLWTWRGNYVGELMNTTDDEINIVPIMFVVKNNGLIEVFTGNNIAIPAFEYRPFSVFSDSIETNDVQSIQTYMKFKLIE